MKYSIALDTADLTQNNTKINLKRNDTNSHSFVFTVTEDGAEKDFSSYRAVVKFVRSDRQRIISGDLTPNVNVITYEVDSSVMKVEGIVKGEISLYKDDERITTNMFRLNIVGDIDTDGSFEGDDRLPILDELLTHVMEVYRLWEEGKVEWNNILGKEFVEEHLENRGNPHEVELEQTKTKFITNEDIMSICK